MKTAIVGFRQDAEGHWVADLACGHSQHVRHQPPFQVRAWTQTEAGRASRVGAELDCPTCEMPLLPADAREYKRTATFTEGTVPAALLRDHETKDDVWARIVVEQGQLEFRSDRSSRIFTLTPDNPGVVPPGVPHQVATTGAVHFHVEFYRREPRLARG